MSPLSDELRTLLQDLEIVEFDINRLATRRHAQVNWQGWTPKARDMSGIHRQLDELYEKKRLLVGKIEALARSKANGKGESLEATGAFSWRGTGVGIWERTLEMCGRMRGGTYVLHSDDKLPKGV